jgi:hypothetical protein
MSIPKAPVADSRNKLTSAFVNHEGHEGSKSTKRVKVILKLRVLPILRVLRGNKYLTNVLESIVHALSPALKK